MIEINIFDDRKQKFICAKSLFYYMESTHRLKPNIFITQYQEDSEIYCPTCRFTMEKVLHTPKDKKPIYHCPNCNNFLPEQGFGLADLK